MFKMSTSKFDNVEISGGLNVSGVPINTSIYDVKGIITSSSYTIIESALTKNIKNIFFIDTTSNAVTINLPAITSTPYTINIIDYSGNALSNNITVSPNGSDKVGGFTSVVINSNGSSIQISSYYDESEGHRWFFS